MKDCPTFINVRYTVICWTFHCQKRVIVASYLCNHTALAKLQFCGLHLIGKTQTLITIAHVSDSNLAYVEPLIRSKTP